MYMHAHTWMGRSKAMLRTVIEERNILHIKPFSIFCKLYLQISINISQNLTLSLTHTHTQAHKHTHIHAQTHIQFLNT